MSSVARSLLALVALELRRNLLGPRGLLLGAILVLAVCIDWAPAPSLLGEAGEETDRIARGLQRHGAWILSLVVLLPAVVLRAAGTGERWRGREGLPGEGDWLGSRPTNRWVALTACALGPLMAGGLLLFSLAAAVELLSPGGEPGLGLVARHDLPGPVLVRPWSPPLEVDLGPQILEQARPGDELRLRCALTLAGVAFGPEEGQVAARPAGPSAQVLWRVGNGQEGASQEEALVRSREWLSVVLPEGDGPIENRLVNRGPGVIALMAPGSLELWRRGAGEGTSSLFTAAHAIVVLVWLVPLALALGFWMSSVTASLMAASVALWAFALQEVVRDWPGHDLGSALTILAEGRVPQPPTGAEWVLSAGLALAALLLGRAGCRSWRHGS